MTPPSLDMAVLAEEIRMIAHNMRTSLSIFQVGAQQFGKTGPDGAEVSGLMLFKVKEVDQVCDRLAEISAQLKRAFK